MFRSRFLRLWSFRAALEDLGMEWGEPEDAHMDPGARSGRARSFQYGASSTMVSATITESVKNADGWATYRRVAELYAEDGIAIPPPPPSNAADIEQIRQAIRRRPRISREVLLRMRRDFAARNHPDRAPHHLKDDAANVMATANALIDGALRTLPR